MALSRVLVVFSVSGAELLSEEVDELRRDEVCYEPLGCFSLEAPWKTPLRPVPGPLSPEEIGTKVYFYSRPNTDELFEIKLRPDVDLQGAPLDRNKVTVIIIHGDDSSGNVSWVMDMKTALLEARDVNVMIIDWGPGAASANYFQVTGNTRLVAREISRLIDDLDIDPTTLHFVGHSLGAHVAAVAANEIFNASSPPSKVRQITGLDPAQPLFETYPEMVRLDEEDATFIDVLHTDAKPTIPTLGFGYISRLGHVDFYMNGGSDQPGCAIPDPSTRPNVTSLKDLAELPLTEFENFITCPHGRAHDYYIESLNSNCTFYGQPINILNYGKAVFNTLTQGALAEPTDTSLSCSRETCIPVGLDTKDSPLRGAFVVTTNGRPPYCIKKGQPAETDD